MDRPIRMCAWKEEHEFCDAVTGVCVDVLNTAKFVRRVSSSYVNLMNTTTNISSDRWLNQATRFELEQVEDVEEVSRARERAAEFR